MDSAIPRCQTGAIEAKDWIFLSAVTVVMAGVFWLTTVIIPGSNDNTDNRFGAPMAEPVFMVEDMPAIPMPIPMPVQAIPAQAVPVIIPPPTPSG